MNDVHLMRRDLLKVSALGAAALVLPLERLVRAKSASRLAAGRLPAPYTLPFRCPPVIDATNGAVGTEANPVVLEQRAARTSILPGLTTTIFGYALPGQAPTTPGPTIHARRGTPITVLQANKLPTVHPFLGYDPWTSTHLHGSASRPQYDGYASDITRVGQTKRYRYPNKQDARTLWYHDHGVHHTAENAYMGLAAQYHLHDDVESGLAVPKWVFGQDPLTKPGPDGIAQQFDLPLIIQDKMFGANGEFQYDDAGHSGLWGDVILVNGVPWPKLRVYRRKYRFRILNASLSRGYRLQLGDASPLNVIGTDGGLMPQVQTTTQLRVGMAERYEVVIDFARYAAGARVELRNMGVPNSVDYDNTARIMQFEVVGDAVPGGLPPEVTLPAGGLYSLNPNREVWELNPATVQGTTRIAVVRDGGEWRIQSSSTTTGGTVATTVAGSGTARESGESGSGGGSGRGGRDGGSGGRDGGSGGGGGGGTGGGAVQNMTWADVVSSGYRNVVANPASGDVQIWEITNRSGGWFHPVHIHLVDFKVLSRNGGPAYPYEQGPKDVVYVGENETIRAIMRFGKAGDPSTDGRYMIHCHNLPHEDHDMMTQFRVGKDVDRNPDPARGPDDPVNADCNDPINADPATTTKA